jgi:O-antigen/teichoic acid export membrane protein
VLSGRFIGPVLTLATGGAVAQLLTAAARPVLTRLYGPEEFGVLTLFVTIVTLAAVAGTGRYEDAMMLPARRADAARLFGLALAISLITSIVLALLLPWRAGIAGGLGATALASSLALLPAAALGAAWARAMETWLTRADRFRIVAAGRLAQGTVTPAIQLAAGFAGAGAVGLTIGATAGFLVLVAIAAGTVVLRDASLLRTIARGSTSIDLARRYRRFPAYTAPAGLLNMLSTRVPIFGLAATFGAATTGLYGLAFGMLTLPVGTLTGAVGQVFFVRAAEEHRRGALGALARQVHRRLAVLSIYPMAAAAVAGPEAFALIFGTEWREAGIHARMIAPWLWLAAIAAPLTRVFDVTERQRADLAMSVVQAAGLALALMIGARLGDARVAIGAMAIAGVLLRIVQIALALRIAGARLSHTASDLLGSILGCLPFIACGAVIGWLTGSTVILLVALAVAGVGYYALAVRRDRTTSVAETPSSE